MNKRRRGFTLIEVALFLVITGALFVSVTVGVQNSIYQQRYNDSVQNFAEFLRNVYSGVLNVQNTEGGRSGQAVYGKMITFGEKYDLAGELIDDSNGGNSIFVYNVVGDIKDLSSGDAISLLKEIDANVLTVGNEGVRTVGIAESYTPRWSAEIEPPCEESECRFEPFYGTVLIVRHPESGVVYTYYTGRVIEVNEIVRNANLDASAGVVSAESVNPLREIKDFGFSQRQVDFCVNPYIGDRSSLRIDVRIVKGAKSASGVEVVSNDENVCNMK